MKSNKPTRAQVYSFIARADDAFYDKLCSCDILTERREQHNLHLGSYDVLQALLFYMDGAWDEDKALSWIMTNLGDNWRDLVKKSSTKAKP